MKMIPRKLLIWIFLFVIGNVLLCSYHVLNRDGQTKVSGNRISGSRNRTGYVLELNSGDQLTGGAYNVLSLQCMIGHIDAEHVVVVEPFMTKGVWGTHLSGDQRELTRENNMRLSDIYDIQQWESVASNQGYAKLASWEDFLEYAPRDLILVHFQSGWFDGCSIQVLSEKYESFFKMYNFNVVKAICFDFSKSGVLSFSAFTKELYEGFAPSSVSVVFNIWNGIQNTQSQGFNRYMVQLSTCSRALVSMFQQVLNPSHRLLKDADKYIEKYLNDSTSYLSIMTRLEYAILFNGNRNKAEETVKMCVEKTMNAFSRIKGLGLTYGVFLTMDIGKYGSVEFTKNKKRGNSTAIEAIMIGFFKRIFYGQALTFSDWEESFVNIIDFTEGSIGPYVASLQKVVASRGRCIIVSGGGSFQKSALNLYKEHKKDKNLCYIVLDARCSQVKVVLP